MGGIKPNAVYELYLKYVNKNIFSLIQIAKIGNSASMNQLFQRESQAMVIPPVAAIENIKSIVFYQKQEATDSILRLLILNLPQPHNVGYGRFEKSIDDAVLVKVKNDRMQVIIFEGQRNYTLQIYQMMKDGQYDESISELLSRL